MRGFVFRWPLWMFLLVGSVVAQAEVTLDGTLGSSGSLQGPDYLIPSSVGHQDGANLFHSFGHFNVATGESATFTGPSTIEHVIGRVTGGASSYIDGTLRTKIVGGANLWLINPAGVVFGQNAQLDVQGSVHVSTADYLRLGEKGWFDATTPENTLLSSAPPSAFGFLSAAPASISLNGSRLEIPPGETFSLVSGDLTARTTQIRAPGGHIQLASIASDGEVIIGDEVLDISSFLERGAITVTTDSTLDVSGESAGSVTLRGGQLWLEDTTIQAVTNAATRGRIELDSGDITMNGSDILSSSLGDGEGAAVYLNTGTLLLTEESHVRTTANAAGSSGPIYVAAENLQIRQGSEITTNAFRSGNAGLVTVDASDLRIDGNGVASVTGIGSLAHPFSSGDTGRVNIRANRLQIVRGAPQVLGVETLTGIGSIAMPFSTGDANLVQVDAQEIALLQGGVISSGTFGGGDAGSLEIKVGHLVIDGGDFFDPTLGTGIASSAQRGSSGHGGKVTVTASDIILRDGGAITSNTFALGDAGSVTVRVSGQLLIENTSSNLTGISSSPHEGSTGNGGLVNVEAQRIIIDGTGANDDAGIGTLAFIETQGNAGAVEVTADEIQLINGGSISSGTRGTGDAGSVLVTASDLTLSGIGLVPSNISSSAESPSTGAGGQVIVRARRVVITDGGLITARSSSSTKDAGDVFLQFDRLELNSSTISTESLSAHGGNIELQSNEGLLILTHGDITTSVTGGESDAGNITISHPAVAVLMDGSQIKANAESGDGGNIAISVGVLLKSPDSLIDASSAEGIDGVVEINSPVVDLTTATLPLPVTYIDASKVMTKPCAERSGADVIQLTSMRYEVLPESPHVLRAPDSVISPSSETNWTQGQDVGCLSIKQDSTVPD
ncbi:MAG: filamentous hemagglutinin N-terminal domain-containing protein [Pseudomonadota bacterium]